MLRTHYVAPAAMEAARGNIGRVMFLRPICGARATARAQLHFTTDAARTDCKRCLTALAAEAATA
jgi:hypothetical protein